MRNAVVTPEGDRIRWVELPGGAPARVYMHGLGATSPAYFAASAVHPLPTGRRSLLVDLLGHGHSDRPEGFGCTLEEHADALAAVLTEAGAQGAELIAHSMGGAVAVVLADRHPQPGVPAGARRRQPGPRAPQYRRRGEQPDRLLPRVPGRRLGRGA
ncbi:alpha/beta fold hydrolase [Streptomyces sp. NPDC090021]|uniref:alpha/beta fold hydrolase n=1 Tax=Streptomyces sp. NPDC090021 TaxID=3365919 RepID=UPI003813899F